MDDRRSPLAITADSSREEVLAAVDEFERRAAESGSAIEAADFGELPPVGQRRGCYWSKDGRYRVHYGQLATSPSLEAQKLAGEEDQSAPGWDQGA